jgi:hypothetical protein
MRPDDRGIDDRARFIDIELQRLEDARPDTPLSPVAKPIVDGFPRAEALRQVAPRTARLGAVEDRVDEESVSELRCRARAALRQQALEALPLLVGEGVAVHRQL